MVGRTASVRPRTLSYATRALPLRVSYAPLIVNGPSARSWGHTRADCGPFAPNSSSDSCRQTGPMLQPQVSGPRSGARWMPPRPRRSLSTRYGATGTKRGLSACCARIYGRLRGAAVDTNRLLPCRLARLGRRVSWPEAASVIGLVIRSSRGCVAWLCRPRPTRSMLDAIRMRAAEGAEGEVIRLTG